MANRFGDEPIPQEQKRSKFGDDPVDSAPTQPINTFAQGFSGDDQQWRQNKPVRQTLSDIYTPLLEGVGFVGGAAAGGGAGLPTGPGAVATSALAAGGGYAMGKSGARRLDELTGLREPQGIAEATKESVQDIMTGTTLEMGGQIVGKYIIEPAVASASEKLSKIIRSGMEKGVRPTVKGKTSNSTMNQYFDRAESGIKSIISNKSSLRLTDKNGNIIDGELPKTLKQFSEAVDHTKRNIFNQYDALQKAAGETGATIDLRPIANELITLSENEVLKTESPGIAKFAKRKAEEYLKQGSYTPSQAQEAIASMNQKLLEYYKSGKVGFAGRKSVEDLAATNLRKALDDVIEKATGNPNYQELKNAYGSLRTIEKDVAHRSQIDARKSNVGFFGYADIWTAAEAVQAITDPTKIPRVIAIQGTKRAINWINNPNRIIKSMFNNAEKYMNGLPKNVQEQIIESMPLKRVEAEVYRYNPEFKGSRSPRISPLKTEIQPSEAPLNIPVREKLFPDQLATVREGKMALRNAKDAEARIGQPLIQPGPATARSVRPNINIKPSEKEIPAKMVSLMEKAGKQLSPNKAKVLRARALEGFNKERKKAGLSEFTVAEVERAIKAKQEVAKAAINKFRKSKGLPLLSAAALASKINDWNLK